MPGSASNILTKLSVAVGGVLVSAANGLPVIGANDTTASGNISSAGTGSAVTIACDGRSSVTVGLSGTWTGTVVWEAYDGVSWWPMRAHIMSAAGIATAGVSTTSNVTVTIPCGGYSQVRIYASVYSSGPIVVTRRASFANRAVQALISAMAPNGGAAPDTSVQIGVKDGSSNLQPLTLGQALAALCMPVVLPVAQDVVAYAGSGGKIGVTTAQLPASLGAQASSASASVTLARAVPDSGSTLATTGRLISGSAIAGSILWYSIISNGTGGSVIPMFFDRSTTNPGDGSVPLAVGATVTSGGSTPNAAIGSTLGVPFSSGMLLIMSSTAGTLTKIASTAVAWTVTYLP